MASQTRRARTIHVEQLEPSRTVLLLVDFINPLNFDGAEDLSGTAVSAARATGRLRQRLGREGCQAVYANDNYGVWRSDFSRLWQSCSLVDGPPGAMAKALRPRKQDFTILKPRHSAFYSTPLDLLLRQLKCQRLVLTGVAADNCVLFTAMDAYLRGYSLWIPADCTAAESEDAKQQALQHMARVLKADVSPSTAKDRPRSG
jgi:nicotinamidase-related amidase